MKITIIYDNTCANGRLEADWGFAALIEAHGRSILFDTGASGRILLANMEKLGISPEQIDDVFISHNHFDHTGGLSAFLDIHNDVRVIVPPSFRGVKNVREMIEADHPFEISFGIHTTGEIEGIEQFLCIENNAGIVIIAGCSHPDMTLIFESVKQIGKPIALIGGLHGTSPDKLSSLKYIFPTHCTRYKAEIKEQYPDAYREVGAGLIIDGDILI